MNMEDEFDYTQPLHAALSQLIGSHYDDGMEVQVENNEYPKPAELCAMADDSDPDEAPPTTMEIIDELVDVLNDYPKTCQVMMRRGLLKRRQQCRKCMRQMTLRRRKNAYEWRCRTRDKKGDCSSCSIKTGSWFEFTKTPFKMLFNFLIMHCKMCSPAFITEQLKLTYHATNEIRRFMYQLTDRIVEKYTKIGKNNQEVYMEIIIIKPKVSVASPTIVAAGKEVGSNLCFAVVINNTNPDCVRRAMNNHVEAGARVTMIKTVGEPDADTMFLNEMAMYPHQKDRFFTSLRRDPPDNTLANGLFQSWLNDQVARKNEGTRLLERCIEELQSYTTQSV